MAEEVGAAFVSLVPSASGFSKSARKELRAELRDTAIPISIVPEVDQRAVTAALTGLGDGIQLPLAVDPAEAVRETRDAVHAAESTDPTIHVDIDVDRRPLGQLFDGGDVDSGGRATGQRLGVATLTGLGDSLRSGLGVITSSISGNPIVSTLGTTLGVGIGVFAAPAIFGVIGAATAAATLAGLGLGAIFAGAFILSSNPVLQQAWSGFQDTVMGVLQDAAQPLVQPLVEGLDIVADAFQVIGPSLREMFAGIAPVIPALADGVAGFITAFTPGLVDAVVASGPVLEQIAFVLPGLGAALAAFLSDMAAVAPQAAALVGMLGRGLAVVIRLLGGVLRIGAEVFGAMIPILSGLWDSLRVGFDLLSIIGALIAGDMDFVRRKVGDAVAAIGRWWSGLWGDTIPQATNAAIGWLLRTVRGLPGRIRSALGSLGGLLYQAGRNVVQGLIDGIRAMFGRLGSTASSLAGTIRNYLPFSPAKEGPLSGSGNPYLSGQSIARMVAGGMTSQLPAVAGAADGLAGAASIGGRGSFSTSTPGRLVAEWVGGDGDPIVQGLREHIRIHYEGSAQVAFGGG